MNKLNLFSIKSAAIVLTLTSLSLAGNVQAHHYDDEYLSLVPFLLYSVISQPRHYYSYKRHSHKYNRHQKKHNHRSRQHSHSRDGYSHSRPTKKHRRH